MSVNGARSGGDLDDAVSRRRSAASATMAATSSDRDRLEQDGRDLTLLPSTLESAMPPRNSMNWVARTIVYGRRRPHQFLLGDLGAEIAVVRPVDGDDRQCDMVPDTQLQPLPREGCGPRSRKFQHCLVFK